MTLTLKEYAKKYFEPEFIALVRKEIAIANKAARQGLEPKSKPKPKLKPKPKVEHKPPGPPKGRYKAGKCKTCGIDKNDRTLGCATCYDRHYHRWIAGVQAKPPRLKTGPAKGTHKKGFCKKCGCDRSEFTKGCIGCYWRHRRRKEALKAIAEELEQAL